MIENEIIFFPYGEYDSALIGITEDDRAVYDYCKMIDFLVENEDMDYEEAAEWIDYNTVGSLMSMGIRHPIIMYPIEWYM